jgi:heptaprenyl diphosphate synthase
MKTRKILRLSLLTAVSLVLFVLENQIPAPVPVPGVKLGLGNVIVVAVLFLYGRREALAVLGVKIVLSAVVTGNLGALAYSAAGGLLSWGGMCLLRGLLRPNQLWVASVLGAMLHNLGQLLAAVLIAATPGLWAYLPVLLLSGMITGFFTGIAAQTVVKRLRKPVPECKMQNAECKMQNEGTMDADSSRCSE